MNYLFMGILLGMGAAIPIGPVNLEMIRRNLNDGTSYGVMLGLGACTADITYLILLCLGALTLLQYPEVLRTLGFLGSLILAWFAMKAFRTSTKEVRTDKSVTPSLARYGFEGYAITLINPYTILFWASISSQITAIANEGSILFAGIGVVIGTVGWVMLLNTILHMTRHRLNQTVIRWMNYSGGIILLGFACLGLIKTIFY